MITVDSCFCFSLTTGVLIIASLQLIGDILGAIVFVVGIIFSIKCLDPVEALNKYKCELFGKGTIALFYVLILLCILFAFFAWRCVEGALKRDHTKIKPMMILLGISAVLSALSILSFTPIGVAQALLDVLINGYFFVVTFSLYNVIRREHESGGNNRPDVHYQVAGKV